MAKSTAEHRRLVEARQQQAPWKKWGPYLSERQWGTVRENFNRSREAWEDLTHDQSRSRAYQSGEDGIAGFCDDQMLLCFCVGLWNGRDAILKERLFGLTNGEGNHGEDVKEYYFYLDSTPTHSYAKMLYKYPQAPFPYTELVAENRRRSRNDFEYELIDTGIFNEDRYWDVFVEYSKQEAEDVLIRITAVNRGPETATLHVVPQLWFRNTWWQHPDAPRPSLAQAQHPRCQVVAANHDILGARYLYCAGEGQSLFTDNETNQARLYGQNNPTPYVKDGINDWVVNGRREAVNPAGTGTKSAFHRELTVAPGQSQTVLLRLCTRAPATLAEPFPANFHALVDERRTEADQFWGEVIPANVGDDGKQMLRQGYASLLWTKQAYVYDVDSWLKVQGVRPEAPGNGIRNRHWFHMYSADVISMPDKWEYPWFAAWDLAFHTTSLAVCDPDFAIKQLDLMLHERYQHPNGQLPAYEWNFEDVNPPVHAWAALFNYKLNHESLGADAIPFLKRTFNKLLFNFTWWLNRKDRDGNNVFEGGFLGLDNIGVFDRSAALPTGGYLEQADGTAWMAFYAQNMLEMAVELSLVDASYEPLAVKFYEHVIRIAAAANQTLDNTSMWDEEDGFFYDVLRVPGQWSTRIKVRSVVGLLPMCAVSVFRPEVLAQLPEFAARVRWFNQNRPDLLANINPPGRPGVRGRYMLSLLTDDKLRRVLARMLDPAEFLGDHGIRSLSRYHLDHPYVFHVGSQEYRVGYLPGESDTGMFGGNSNWRGPVWFPVNFLLVESLQKFHHYFGDELKVECPRGSGQMFTLWEAAAEISKRLTSIFLVNAGGTRPVFGANTLFQHDPYWRDLVPFHEYFHGDTGAGIGASHQTGWTALVAKLLQQQAGEPVERMVDSRRKSEAARQEESRDLSGIR
jgi:hypothetical protein